MTQDELYDSLSPSCDREEYREYIRKFFDSEFKRVLGKGSKHHFSSPTDKTSPTIYALMRSLGEWAIEKFRYSPLTITVYTTNHDPRLSIVYETFTVRLHVRSDDLLIKWEAPSSWFKERNVSHDMNNANSSHFTKTQQHSIHNSNLVEVAMEQISSLVHTMLED